AVVSERPRVEVVTPAYRPQETAESVLEPQPVQVSEAEERAQFINFENSLGDQMIFIPSGRFVMGSEAIEAAPNERPLTRVTLSRYYLSRHLITNAEYELFDSAHARKRPPGAGDEHPVVYVSSLDAIKFCQWLTTR